MAANEKNGPSRLAPVAHGRPVGVGRDRFNLVTRARCFTSTKPSFLSRSGTVQTYMGGPCNFMTVSRLTVRTGILSRSIIQTRGTCSLACSQWERNIPPFPIHKYIIPPSSPIVHLYSYLCSSQHNLVFESDNWGTTILDLSYVRELEKLMVRHSTQDLNHISHICFHL